MSRQKFCRGKHIFVATKFLLVAAPADDNSHLTHSFRPLVSIILGTIFCLSRSGKNVQTYSNVIIKHIVLKQGHRLTEYNFRIYRCVCYTLKEKQKQKQKNKKPRGNKIEETKLKNRNTTNNNDSNNNEE